MKTNEKKNIYTALYEAISAECDAYGDLSDNPTISVNTDVEGYLDGEFIVASFVGEIEVSGYYYSAGDYYNPPEGDCRISYEGDLCWYEDEDCTIERVLHVQSSL